MTFAGRLIALYPAGLLSLLLATLWWFAYRPSLLQPLLFLLILYLVPPLSLRLHQALFPIREKPADLSKRRYSPWWGAHQIQVIYTAIPQLEALLRIIPGAYSCWLRLCGSRVGRKVYWTPNVEITDRSMLEIGDNVVFGHRCKLLGHAIKPTGQRMILYCKKITIGNAVFIGAGSRIGVGARIADGVYLPLLTDVYINQTIEVSPTAEKLR
ncbi:MAG: acyl transferase [Acidobacteria bacterium]|nr:acyl transferase [Acidobacteriota bacterium]